MMKKCPFCAEEIQDEAIVCKHCGRALAPEKVTRVSEDLASQDKTSKALEAFAKTEDGNGEAPVWKKAIRWGGIFAIVFAIYILSQYSQGRVSSDRVVLDLLFGIVIWFVCGTFSISAWRNQCHNTRIC